MVGKEIFFIIHSFGDELLQQLHMELLRLCCVFHHLTYCFYCLISFHKFQLLRFLCPFLMMDFFSPLSYLIHRKYISEHKERWWWRKLFLCKKDFSDYNIFFSFLTKRNGYEKMLQFAKETVLPKEIISERPELILFVLLGLWFYNIPKMLTDFAISL